MAERTVDGIVRALLPSGLYEVDVEGARITAHIGGGLEKNFIRVLVGDRVIVELAPRDLARGRIVRVVSGRRWGQCSPTAVCPAN
ncbi:MAG: translation initiation factor IF-1 [Acidobacteria bacterium]|nr:translation initiation factor IF-1 [Acidobacteriota bacterium]